MDYKILQGDNVDLLTDIEENSIDLVVTDPPYGMEIAGAEWDKDVPPAEVWSEVLRVLKPGAWCLSFCSPELYHRMATKMEDGGFVIKDQVVWMVTTKMAKANKLKPAHEPIAVAQKPISEKTIKENIKRWNTGTINIDDNRIPWEGKPPTGWVSGGQSRRAFGDDVLKSTEQDTEKVNANVNGRYPSNIVGNFDIDNHQKYFYAPRVTRKERGEYNNHPTPKPIDLMRWLISVYAPGKNSVVLDPFSGSGSTGIAALMLDHTYIGMDLSKEYCDISEKRINDFLGYKQSDIWNNLFDE
jgi:site-specific DNA-methyltransferase (adenine-specific)